MYCCPITPILAGSLTCARPLLQTKADAMVKHLASLADQRLIISFAPKTVAYSILKRIGELFPGPSKVRLHALLRLCNCHTAFGTTFGLVSCVPR